LVFTTGTNGTGSKLGEKLLGGIVRRSLGDMSKYQGKEYNRWPCTGSPLEIIVPVVSNVSPFPVLSIRTALIDREPASVLKVLTSADPFDDIEIHGGYTHSKFVTLTRNSPSIEAATAVEVSRLSTMFIVPQRADAEGFWTSFTVGVPLTPRAGATAAWALTEDVKARKNVGAINDLENISPNNGK